MSANRATASDRLEEVKRRKQRERDLEQNDEPPPDLVLVLPTALPKQGGKCKKLCCCCGKKDEWKTDEEFAEMSKGERDKLTSSILQAGLMLKKVPNSDPNTLIYYVTASSERLEQHAAEEMRLPMKTTPEFSGIMYPFQHDRREMFVNHDRPGGIFDSATRQKVMFHLLKTKRRHGGAGLDITELQEKGVLKAIFPTHNRPYIKKLYAVWRKFFSTTPVEFIRQYFGSKVGFYFAYLEYYTMWLTILAFFGLLVQAGKIYDKDLYNVLVPGYTIFVVVWGFMFLQSWAKKAHIMAVMWNVADYEEVEQVRPEFKGQYVPDPVYDGKRKMKIYPSWKRLSSKYPVSISVVGSMMIAVIIAFQGILVFKAFAKANLPFGGPIAGITNGVAIFVMNSVYKKVATWLTNFENHRTQTDYENKLIVKIFMFQFVNSYASLFYVAFLKKTDFIQDDECLNNDCMGELEQLLLSVFLTQIVVGNVMEVVLPMIPAAIKRVTMTKEQREAIYNNQVEYEAMQPEYQNTMDDFAEMVVQFGYVTLFAAAFPPSSTLALLNNLVEKRTDAYKLCFNMQRPQAAEAADIGSWFAILDFMCVVSVLSNVGIFCFTSETLESISRSPDKTPAQNSVDNLMARALVYIAMENLLLGFRYLVSAAFPAMPDWILTHKQREKVLSEKLTRRIAGEPSDSDEDEPVRKRMSKAKTGLLMGGEDSDYTDADENTPLVRG